MDTKDLKFYSDDTINVYSPNKYEPGGVWFVFHHQPSNEIIVIDCGIGFTPEITFDSELSLYDARAEQHFEFIAKLACQRKTSAPLSILGTQGHLDHIKGIPLMAKTMNIDVYASWFTMECIERQIRKQKDSVEFGKHIFNPGYGELEIGVFKIKYFQVSHSAPQTYSFIIEVPRPNSDQYNKYLFLTEMRLPDLPFETGVTERAIQTIKNNVPYNKVFFDGLYFSKPGYSVGEETVREPIKMILHHKDIKGNVILPYISSKLGITRILMEEARDANWAFLPYGKMMEEMIQLGTEADWLPDKFFPEEGTEYRIVKPVTGSQAEIKSILYKTLAGEKTDEKISLQISSEDWLVILQGLIPDNIERVRWQIRAASKICKGILIPRDEIRRLKIRGKNIYIMEEFLGLKKTIKYPSGHERRNGILDILAATQTPIDDCEAYQNISEIKPEKEKIITEMIIIESTEEDQQEPTSTIPGLDDWDCMVKKVTEKLLRLVA